MTINFEKTIPKNRYIQRVYSYLPERFCTYCGAKGIYEDDCDDFYTGVGEFCFACEEIFPNNFYDGTSLAKLKARDAVVIDSRHWVEMVSEIDLLLERQMNSLCSSFSKDLYSAAMTDNKFLGLESWGKVEEK